MSPGGWIFMLASNGFVLGLLVFCFFKVLAKPRTAGRLHAPSTTDTGDEGT